VTCEDLLPPFMLKVRCVALYSRTNSRKSQQMDMIDQETRPTEQTG